MTGAGDAAVEDNPGVEGLVGELVEIEDELPSDRGKSEVREAQGLLVAAARRGILDTDSRRLHSTDAAEALIGSVVFATPLLVEDGVFDIAHHLISYSPVGIPVFLLANVAFVCVMTYALVEWTGRDRTETMVIPGGIPLRVVMILGVSFVVAAILMTVWGRVDGWTSPIEGVSRVIVLWTVGSLGAALGDILSERPVKHASLTDRAGDPERLPAPSRPEIDRLTDAELLTVIHDRFDDLARIAPTEETRDEIDQLRIQLQAVSIDGMFGQRIKKYTSRDIAEAFVGSIFFSIPLLVENGVFAVADYFLSIRVSGVPVFLFANAVFVFLMVSALVYWAGPQRVEVSRPLFGVIPRRLVGITIISFLTAAFLMTMWGRVGHWEDPLIGVARVSTVWTVAAFGASLGDVLPGESSGDDLYDDLADIRDLTGY